MRVHIHTTVNNPEREMLEQAALPGERWTWQNDYENELEQQQIHGAEVIFGNPPVSLITAGNALKWVQLISAGIDPYQHLEQSLLDRVLFTNLRGFFATPVAESIVAAILAWYRKIPEIIHSQELHVWIGDHLRPRMELLDGKRVLVLGSGAIGKRLAAILEVFGCHVQLTDSGSEPGLSDIELVLAAQDIVIGCLPDTPSTRGLFNLATFSKMKSTAMFVNAGRGSLVVEPDLVEALRNGLLGCAILDVTNQEPIASSDALWSLPNLILTQHTAGGYRQEREDKIKIFLENLKRYRTGEPLLNVVNFQKGY